MQLDRTGAWYVAPLLLLGALGCARAEPAFNRVGGPLPERSHLLQVGKSVRRIDGDIRDVMEARVTADRDQILCLTGPAGGADQCQILVLESDGALAARYPVSGVTPWETPPSMTRDPGEPRRQRQCPTVGQVQPVRHGTRRLLAVGSGGMFYPSSLILLEATAPNSLEERLVFWNAGSIKFLRCDGPDARHVALVGRNNRFREGDQYRPILAVFSVAEVLGRCDRGPCVRGTSPERLGEGGSGVSYRIYVVLSTDGGDDAFDFVDAKWSGGRFEAFTASGLVYAIDPDAQTCELAAGAAYVERHAKRLQDDPGTPPLGAHLRALRDSILLFAGPG